jgi:hypothetical protein
LTITTRRALLEDPAVAVGFVEEANEFQSPPGPATQPSSWKW